MTAGRRDVVSLLGILYHGRWLPLVAVALGLSKWRLSVKDSRWYRPSEESTDELSSTHPAPSSAKREVFGTCLPLRPRSFRDITVSQKEDTTPDLFAVDHLPHDGRQREIPSRLFHHDTALFRPRWALFYRILRRVLVAFRNDDTSRQPCYGPSDTGSAEASVSRQYLRRPVGQGSVPPVHPFLQNRMDGTDGSQTVLHVDQPFSPLSHHELPVVGLPPRCYFRCRTQPPEVESHTLVVC